MFGKLKASREILFSMIGFGIFYALISLVNHYFFRTYALDLGIYNNALYDYLHFQWNDSLVFKENGENLLADHFDLYLIIFSPLSLIFGTYTLLIVQFTAIVIGGWGVHSFFKSSPKTEKLALVASLYFYTFFGVFSALSFDYQSNVVAASLLPWFFYFIKKKRLRNSSLLLVFLLIAKENVSLWLIFVCLGLAYEYRKKAVLRNYLCLAAVCCGFYFYGITSHLMPALSNNDGYHQFRYSVLGNSYAEAIVHLLTSPLESLKVLFTNHMQDPLADYVKAELHLLLLFSGLPLLFGKPQYLFMLIPIYFQKLFHDNPSVWSIGGHYSMEFAPILAIGAYQLIADFKSTKVVKITALSLLFLSIVSTVRIMDNSLFYMDRARIRFYQEIHYQKDYEVSKVHEQLEQIPKDAIVSAQSPFLPHLALRESIYQFPTIKDAEYLVYSNKEISFPLKKKEFDAYTASLENSREWEVIFKGDVVVLKKSTTLQN